MHQVGDQPRLYYDLTSNFDVVMSDRRDMTWM